MLVLDGAMGTELSRRGFDLSDPLWSAKVLIEHPDAVLALHLDYLDAGADLISTASYQISEEGFARVGLSPSKARAALTDSLRLAERAVQLHAERSGTPARTVAVSLGPYGAILADGSEYTGRYALSYADLVRFHRSRFAVLADAGASLLALETFPSIHEAEAALEALEPFTELQAWLSFVPREAPPPVETLSSERLLALSFNCGPPELTLRNAARVAALSRRPVFAYPNRGGTWDPVTKTWAHDQPFDAAAWTSRCGALGIRGVGGCCELGPEAIRKMRETSDALSLRSSPT